MSLSLSLSLTHHLQNIFFRLCLRVTVNGHRNNVDSDYNKRETVHNAGGVGGRVDVSRGGWYLVQLRLVKCNYGL